MRPRTIVLAGVLFASASICAPAAQATVAATFVDGTFGTSSAASGGAQYDFAQVTVFIDPATTSWVAWNSTPTVSRTDGLFPGQLFLWGGGGFGTDDFIRLMVTNPGGTALTIDLDKNDAFGAHSLSDPMNVIFGAASAAPDALRIDAFGSTAGTRRVFDEAGSHNAVFTTAGNYVFDFSFRNVFGSNAGHSDVYLLVDSRSVDMPEPASLAVLGLGLAGLGLMRRRRRGSTRS